MKKFSQICVIAAATLMTVSCSQEAPVAPAAEGNVSFNIVLPSGIGSRSFADGLSADKLDYAVYDATSNAFITKGSVGVNNSLTATVSLALANGKAYKIAFFAHNSSATGVYTFNAEGKAVNVDYSKMTAYNATDYDCFYHLHTTAVVTGAISQTITLTRPVAQVNWGTNDIDTYNLMYDTDATNLKTTVTITDVKSSFDIISGTLTGDAATVTFPLIAAPADETFPVEPAKNSYLSMNYILAPSAASDLVTATLTPNNGTVNMTPVVVSNMPVQANYRTNVYGPLLTSPANFDVTKDKDFAETANNIDKTKPE